MLAKSTTPAMCSLQSLGHWSLDSALLSLGFIPYFLLPWPATEPCETSNTVENDMARHGPNMKDKFRICSYP